MTHKPTFEVSKKGLAKILTRRGMEFVVLELVQNALDEDSTKVQVRLEKSKVGRGMYYLEVEDDNPEGFQDLAHAYTLYAESPKKDDPTKRGRFDRGEKLVIAACKESKIQSTKGTIFFTDKGRVHSRTKTGHGTIFSGTLRLTKAEVECLEETVRQVIVPSGVDLWFNGERLPDRKPIKTFEAILPTEKGDEEGYLRRTKRKTSIAVYEANGAEPALYELGIPVVEIDCAWNIDIGQRVPLNTDRDNVTPAYMREVLSLVLNEMCEQLGEEEARRPWVDEALESDDVSGDAVDAVLTARFGEKRVIADPSDRESEKRAISMGYAVIHSRNFTKPQWGNIRRSGAALPAGQVTPSPKPFSDDPNAEPADFIPKEKWTPAMKRVAEYAKKMAQAVLDEGITVTMANTSNPFAACYGKRLGFMGPREAELTFNVRRLGKRWFEEALECTQKLDDLLIHEFGHEYSSDHLSEEYHKALSKIGAWMVRLARVKKLPRI
jgi:hypothetical protein